MQYATLTVVLVNKEEIKFHNLDEAAVKHIKETLWSRGVKKWINKDTYEILSPFVICRAYITLQTGKVNTEDSPAS